MLLVDAAQGIEAQTLANLYMALENDLVVIPVLNKIDLPAADPDKYAAELAHLIGGRPEDCLRVSGKTGDGVTELLDHIVEHVPAPTGDETGPPRAMIFDSVYDSYRGVVTYVRVKDGVADRPRAHLDDVDPGQPRASRDRRHLTRDGALTRPRGRGGRLPHHRRERRAPVEGGRHGDRPAQARRPGAGGLPRTAADGLLRALPDRRRRSTPTCERPWRSSSSTTPPCSTSRRPPRPWASASAAGSSACCTWRSSGSGSSASSTWASSPPHRTWSTGSSWKA